MSDLGAWLRAHRAPDQMSQTQLAELLGRSRTWLSSLEQGQFKPRAEDCLRLAAIFEVAPEEVLRVAGYGDEAIAMLVHHEPAARLVVIEAAELRELLAEAVYWALARFTQDQTGIPSPANSRYRARFNEAPLIRSGDNGDGPGPDRITCVCGASVLRENWPNHLLRQDNAPHRLPAPHG